MTKTTKPTASKIVPFMPYTGGKRRLLPVLRENMPLEYNHYHEPFLGGGALALDEMANHGKEGRKYFLSDFSQNVVDAFMAVKECPQETAGHIETMMMNHCRTSFMSIRSWDDDGFLPEKTLAERGARFIYLSHTSFGAQVKAKAGGGMGNSFAWKMNTATGVREYDYENMFAVSALLNSLDVSIFHASYEAVLDNAGYGDFIYLDPPYDPKSDTGATLATRYMREPIARETIRKHIDDMTTLGCMVLLSDADTAVIREQYQGWAQSRPPVVWQAGNPRVGEELLVSNWRLADKLTAQTAQTAL